MNMNYQNKNNKPRPHAPQHLQNLLFSIICRSLRPCSTHLFLLISWSRSHDAEDLGIPHLLQPSPDCWRRLICHICHGFRDLRGSASELDLLDLLNGMSACASSNSSLDLWTVHPHLGSGIFTILCFSVVLLIFWNWKSGKLFRFFGGFINLWNWKSGNSRDKPNRRRRNPTIFLM